MNSAQKSAGATAKVLVVDDEEDVVAYLVAVLEDHGFEAVAERDGAAAFEVIRRERPDLILLDIMMPGQSGLALYREIRRTTATAAIPVFMITGVSREEDLAKILNAPGAENIPLPDGYLEKPISVPKFLQGIQRLFDTRKVGDRDG